MLPNVQDFAMGYMPHMRRAGDCAVLELLPTSRVGRVLNFLNWTVTSYFLPYVWNKVVYKLCCDGSFTLEALGSVVPEHFVYMDGRLARSRYMSSNDVKRFMDSAGDLWSEKWAPGESY
jgi:hypothetical protein